MGLFTPAETPICSASLDNELRSLEFDLILGSASVEIVRGAALA